MMQEFERAFEICKAIIFSPRPATDWSPLYEPLRFFEVPKAFYVLVSLGVRQGEAFLLYAGGCVLGQATIVFFVQVAFAFACAQRAAKNPAFPSAQSSLLKI
jgi:hypothetical protein